MKKSLLLIPSLVALSTTPFIGLTSCFESEGGGDKPEPTPPEPTPPIDETFSVNTYIKKFDDRIREMVSDTQFDVGAGKYYRFNIDMTKWFDREDYASMLSLYVLMEGDDMTDRVVLTLKNFKVSIDGVKFDTKKCRLEEDGEVIRFDSSNFEEIMKADAVQIDIQVSNQATTTDNVNFKLIGNFPS